MNIAAKMDELESWLEELGGVVIAYSGGVDSTFLAAMAHRTLGTRALAVTAESAIYPTAETRRAEEIASQLSLRHRVIHTQEIEREDFAANTPLRCYHCKQELFTALFTVAAEESLQHVVDGQHADDANDFRPGAKAARELGIQSPLAILGFSKDMIRSGAKTLGLPNWDKPPHPCLSTRFAYGMKLTQDRLEQVEDAETFLKQLGVGELRIRQHGNVARIEVSPQDYSLFIDPEVGPRIVDALKRRGYRYVTLDLEGFRSGSMNEELVQGGWTRERKRNSAP